MSTHALVQKPPKADQPFHSAKPQRSVASADFGVYGGQYLNHAADHSNLNEPQVLRDNSKGIRNGFSNFPATSTIDLSRIPVHRKMPATLQTKAELNKTGDAYESEANQAKEQTRVTTTSTLQRKCSCGGKCTDCQNVQEEHEAGDNRKHAASALENGVAPGIVHETLQSSGDPLDKETRDFMEQRFGKNFSHVKVHTDAKAAASAKAVHALAYTVGNHVVFGAGRYTPETTGGRRLIAHELTHVVQQSPFLSRQPDGGVAPAGNTGSAQRVTNLAALLERYADQAEARLSTASQASVTPTRNNIRELREGIERLRGAAVTGNGQTCEAILSGFTPARLRAASQLVTPVEGQQPVAVAEQMPVSLAAKSLSIDQPDSPAEVEADQVADAVLSNKQVTVSARTDVHRIQCLLDSQALQQLEQNMPAVVAASGAALEGAAVIAAGGGPPGWVIGLGIVAVVAIVAVGGYFYYRSQQPEVAPQLQPAPTPTPTPSPTPLPETQPQPRPQSPPNPDTEEDHTQGCRAMATAQRGSNSCHDQFATMMSGSPREWGVETPEGLYADFDGRAADRLLYEVKTGYGFLLNTSPSTYLIRERTIHDFIEQSQNQLAIATRCGYQLIWVFNNRQVAEMVDGMIQPQVIWRNFPCEESR